MHIQAFKTYVCREVLAWAVASYINIFDLVIMQYYLNSYTTKYKLTKNKAIFK